MTKATAYGVAALILCCSEAVSAASITVRPGASLSGAPGETIGWGYDIVADIDWDLEFTGSFIDLPLAAGDVLDLFDFPIVPAGTSRQLDYDPATAAGLLEVVLSPLLSAGDLVVARVFLDYVRIDRFGVRPDETGVFEFEIRAAITSTAPEPSSLVLMACALAVLAARRSRRRGWPTA